MIASDDRRTHIERINDPAQENTMTPEQFDKLVSILIEYLTPVRVLAERQMAWMDAQETAQAVAAEAADNPPSPRPASEKRDA